MKTTCFKLSLLMLTWNFLYRKPRHGLQKSMSYSDMGSLYVPTFWNALKDHIRHLCQPSSFHKQLPLWLWCSRHRIFSHHSCLFHSHFFFFFFQDIHLVPAGLGNWLELKLTLFVCFNLSDHEVEGSRSMLQAPSITKA